MTQKSNKTQISVQKQCENASYLDEKRPNQPIRRALSIAARKKNRKNYLETFEFFFVFFTFLCAKNTSTRAKTIAPDDFCQACVPVNVREQTRKATETKANNNKNNKGQTSKKEKKKIGFDKFPQKCGVASMGRIFVEITRHRHHHCLRFPHRHHLHLRPHQYQEMRKKFWPATQNNWQQTC